jgi:hypothetical protein
MLYNLWHFGHCKGNPEVVSDKVPVTYRAYNWSVKEKKPSKCLKGFL